MYEKCSSELERPYPSPKGKEKAYEFGKIVFLMESRVRENLTLYPLPRVISGKMIFLRKYRPHDLRNRQLVKK